MAVRICYTNWKMEGKLVGDMTMRYANPYTPRAGFMPGYLAGREEILADAEKYLNTLVLGYP